MATRVLVTRTVADLVVDSRFRFNACGTTQLSQAGDWSIYEAMIDP